MWRHREIAFVAALVEDVTPGSPMNRTYSPDKATEFTICASFTVG